MKNLLITGFDAFGGENINPSWESVKLINEKIKHTKKLYINQ